MAFNGCLPPPQVQYSLLYRAPETNGVLEACRESGTTLVAYSPLCQGLLTGEVQKCWSSILDGFAVWMGIALWRMLPDSA